jgi:selenocysteine lyase/cysteine desulfurase
MAADTSLACARDLFSIPPGEHYLNCAYMSPLSKRVQGAGAVGIQSEATPWTLTASDFFTGCDEARRLFARVVQATEPERIAVIPAASYGMATVARNTRLEAGQNVVTAHQQFPSNLHVWRRLCADSGAVLRVVEAPGADGDRAELWNERLVGSIDGDTALVAIGTVHWTDGTPFDLERIGERAREVGAALVVDGTQSVGAEPLDVGRIRPDALVCSAYKWLTGPYSIGLAYFGTRYDGGVPLEETWAGRRGSEDFASLVAPGEEYRPGAVRYDMGESAAFVLVPMLVAALEQLLEWGVERIAEYVRDLARAALSDSRLAHMGIESDSSASHIFGLRLPGSVDPRQVQGRLAEAHVHVSLRGPVIRVSPHVYNDAGDMEALLGALAVAVSGS